MSRGGDQDGMRVMLFLSLLVTAGLLFGAGVMVGVRLAEPQQGTPAGAPAAADAAQAEPEKATDLVFHEVLEGEKPLEQLGVTSPPDAGLREARRTAPVRPPARENDAREAKSPPSPAEPPPVASGSFCLQVAAYRELEPATQLAGKLREQGLEAVEVLRSDVPGKGVYFRVRLGRFADAPAAESMRQQLMQKLALDALVVRCQ